MQNNNYLEIKEDNREGKEDRKWQYILGLIVIILLILILLFALYLIRRRTSIRSSAFGTNYETRVELTNSYIFASPLKAKANAAEKIRITVFVLDSEGKGVLGRNVELGRADGVIVNEVQKITDDLGRAIFDISSSKPALYILVAYIDGIELPQRLNVTFE